MQLPHRLVSDVPLRSRCAGIGEAATANQTRDSSGDVSTRGSVPGPRRGGQGESESPAHQKQGTSLAITSVVSSKHRHIERNSIDVGLNFLHLAIQMRLSSPYWGFYASSSPRWTAASFYQIQSSSSFPFFFCSRASDLRVVISQPLLAHLTPTHA